MKLFKDFYKEFSDISFEERDEIINSLNDYDEKIILNEIDNLFAKKAQAKVIDEKKW